MDLDSTINGTLDLSVKAKGLLERIKSEIILGSARTTQEKLMASAVVSQLDDVYELFVKQGLELAEAGKCWRF